MPVVEYKNIVVPIDKIVSEGRQENNKGRRADKYAKCLCSRLWG